MRVIADHLRDHEYSWSACDFDFRTAHLEDVDLGRAVFGGTTQFDWATFSGAARFLGTDFGSGAYSIPQSSTMGATCTDVRLGR
jgi:hypothetical protein